MNRDPQIINKNMKVMVKLIAEIINDFFEPLSTKTLIFLALIFLTTIILSLNGKSPVINMPT